MASEVLLYVFDAYGTLLDVHSAVARHKERMGAAAELFSELWRAKQLEYSWVRTLAGAPYHDFHALTEEALDFAFAYFPQVDRGLRGDLLAAYERLAAFPEVAGLFQRLRRQGALIAILSNGAPGMLSAALSSCGLTPFIDATLSVDAVRQYKTAPDAYALVGERFGLPAGAVSFQSANCWDIVGARLAGFRTVWVNRRGAPEEYSDCPAERVIRTLDEL
jgi:2-haloacid dehalogenase